jgi:hypothetical protein
MANTSVHHRPPTRILNPRIHTRIRANPKQPKVRKIKEQPMAVQSPGQIRQAAVIAERKRLNLILDTQIKELWERVNNTSSDDMKSSWTIAILELKQVQDIANNPVNGIRTR